MIYRVEQIDQVAWEQGIALHDEANFLHSWQWGEMHHQLGDTVVRLGVFINDQLHGVALGIVKDARRGRYLEVPGGPLIDWQDEKLARYVMTELHKVAHAHHCVFMRLRPQLHEDDAHLMHLQRLGLKRAPMHLHAEHTNILQLDPSDDELLAAMRRQTRYEVRRASKQALAVSYRTGQEAIDEFYEVQADTAKRQGFVPPSKAALQAQADAFGDALRVYRVEKDGQLLNLAVVLFYAQEAVYHEAASTTEARQYSGAYGLLWQAIQDAKVAGCSRFNFWGIAYSDDPNHRYAGVTTFKRGFGGDDVAFVPAHDLILNNIKYAKNWLIETVRKKKRKL